MKKYNNIIDNFIENQNFTATPLQMNTYSKEEYRNLLDQVLKILKKNKDADIDEIRQKLYENSGIEELLRDFFLKRKKAPGAVINIGENNYQERIIIGNSQEVLKSNGNIIDSPVEMKEDTIFDLASCTKLFTAVAILQLAGRCELRLDDQIKKYLPQFSNLGYHTIFDLLTYQPYRTDKRIDLSMNKEEAEKVLFTASPIPPYELEGKDRYNDIAPMILKYIVEDVSGMNFADYVKENMLIPAKMNNTFVSVPDSLINKVANCNYNYSVLNDGAIVLKDTIEKGISSDDKAVALGQKEGILSGHAGLFSNASDMHAFEKGLIDGTVLHPALTVEMARNRTGYWNYPYYGFLCESKHPNKFISDMHQGLSGVSFSKSGYSGTYVAVDPKNDINLTFLSNRIHNRIISIPDDKKMLLDKNESLNLSGRRIVNSSLYGYDRRSITKACLALAIQEKMLEDIVGKQKEKIKVRKIK